MLDIDVERNGYGRQIDSRVAEIEPEAEFRERSAPGKLEAVFIRAPIIRRAGPRTTVLARYRGSEHLRDPGRSDRRGIIPNPGSSLLLAWRAL